MKKGIVLSSGGIDSTTCLGVAIKELGVENVVSVSIDYGQKHKKELLQAQKIADYYGIKNYVFNIAQILQYSNCPLLASSTEEIKHKSYAQQIEEEGEGMVSTYVPFRNGLFLSVSASLAMSIFKDDDVGIYIGAHADDAAGSAYADCSEEFVATMSKAISIGTYSKVQIVAPLVTFNKAEVVRLGLELKVPYNLTWSCYEGEANPCGSCGTCIDRANAFKVNGVEDPVK